MAMHRYQMMTIIFSLAVLGGCGYAQFTPLAAQTGADEAPAAPEGQPASSDMTENQPTDIEQQQVANIIASIPDQLVLSPGTKRKLPYANTITIASSAPDIVSVEADGTLIVNPAAQNGQQAQVTITSNQAKKMTWITVKSSLASTVKNVNGVPTVTNPLDRMVVVNKLRSLPNGFVPKNLVEPKVSFSFQGKSEKRQLQAEAAKALEHMFAEAKKQQITLLGVSGYRSAGTQKVLFAYNVKTQGIEHASRYSARAGHSEHQTGLAIDVSGKDSKTRLEESFAATAEGKWLAAHAPEYGFIIRYPKGKEAITGYAYEPWHIRYVGVEAAKQIATKGITLEEYFEDAVPVYTQN